MKAVPTTKLAFAFDGQGTFKPGFGKNFLQNKIFITRFQEVCELAQMDLGELSWGKNSIKTANNNEHLQIVLFAQCWALAHATMNEVQLKPQFVLGHSLGELSALVFANVLSLEDGVNLIKKRGAIMEKSKDQIPQDMLIVFDSDENVIRALHDFNDPYLYVSNINSSEQTGVSGQLSTLKELSLWLKMDRNVRSTLLGSGIAFHSPFLDDLAIDFQNEVEPLHFKTPTIPFFSIQANRFLENPFLIKEYLMTHMRDQLHWRSAIQTLLKPSVENESSIPFDFMNTPWKFCEIGPSRILKSFIQKDFIHCPVVSCLDIIL